MEARCLFRVALAPAALDLRGKNIRNQMPGRLMNAADDAKLTAIPGFPWPNPVSCIKEAVCPELCGSRAPVKAQPKPRTAESAS